jgi:peptidoglycan/LPS O-acetylase OafA/YrhL
LVYRPEIDGLRAFAVVPVILFHAGFTAFSGGFVGVDVFFVISGYLITSIIKSDLESGTWSLARFYERRARRILPALFLVAFFCMPFAWFWLGPDDLRDFTKSLTAVATFSSNFLFWSQSGYFESAAELKPLLHTWSLAVEEQYYLAFPLLLMALWNKTGFRHVMTVLLAITAGSLVYSQWRVEAGSSGAFFLLPSRIWELAIGALLALNWEKLEQVSAVHSARWGNALSALGLLLLLAAIFAYDKETSFPGVHALLPTLGAGLLITFANQSTLVGRILGSRPALGVGLISYSAYLWHQPLLSLARHRTLGAPSAALSVAICVATFGLAYLSWRHVEIPFRDRTRVGRRKLVAISVLGTLMLALAGLTPALSKGYAVRYNEQVKRLAEANPPQPGQVACITSERFPIKNGGACVYGNPARVTTAVLGDSHTIPFLNGLHEGFQARGEGFLHLMHTACPPVEDVYRPDIRAEGGCPEFNASAHDLLMHSRDIKTIILIARWSYYLDGLTYDNGEGGIEGGKNVIFDLIENGERSRNTPERRRTVLLRKYEAMINGYLRVGKKVILVYPIPEMGWDVPRQVMRRAILNDGAAEDLSVSYDAYARRNADVAAIFDGLGERHGLVRVRPARRLCNQHLPGRCLAQLHGKMLYIDDDHLSQVGASALVKDILRATASE